MDLDNPKTEKPKLVPLALRMVEGDKLYELDRETLIGREVECTISLDSPHVSRYHAKLVVTDSGAVIEDLRSSNGTFVNGKRIQNKTRISIGDEIRFDEIAFRLTTVDAGAAESTVLVSQSQLQAAAPKAPASKAKAAPKKAPAKRKASKPAADVPPLAVVAQSASEQDDEHTRLLSSEQVNQYASINKHFQKMMDNGSGPRLIAMTAPIRGKVFKLKNPSQDGRWNIGRSKECQVCLPDKSVSRLHAYLEKSEGKFHVHSNPDSSPVLVNGSEHDMAILKHNDHVQIGHAEFVFRLDEQKNKAERPLIKEETNDNTYLIIGMGVVGTLLLLAIAVTMLLNR